MPVTYCYSCSEKIVYDVFKPKQCPHCKQSPHAVINLSKEKKVPRQQPSSRRADDEDDDYNDDVQHVPNINKLKARIDIGFGQIGEKLGSIVESEINTISAKSSVKGRGRPKKIKPPQKLTREADSRSFEDYLSEGRGEPSRRDSE